MADLETMESELLAAEYGLIFKDGYSKAIAPDGWMYEDTFTASEKASFIPRVYAHLQEKRQAQAMRELLEEISYGLKPPRHYVNEDYLDVAVAKINALLGKE